MCLSSMLFMLFFFFKQKTAYEMRISDWSSDVCSSDLPHLPARRIINLDALALGHQRFGQRGGIAAAGKFNEPAAGGADPRRIKRIDRYRGFHGADRQSLVEGKSVSVSVHLGGRSFIHQIKKTFTSHTHYTTTLA